MLAYANYRLARAGAAMLVACAAIALAGGCGPKQARTPAEERASFNADPSRMPPEARQKMIEAQRTGGRTAPGALRR